MVIKTDTKKYTSRIWAGKKMFLCKVKVFCWKEFKMIDKT